MSRELEVTRGQNVIYQMPHDWASIAQFLEPLLARVDATQGGLQLLVVTPDAEVAAAVSAAAIRLLESAEVQIIAATSAPRAARLMELRPAQVLAGSASTILELIRGSALKLDTVRAVCIAWADELLARGEDASLEMLMADLPKDGARVVVAASFNPAVEALIERYARRGRRVVPAASEAGQATPVQYLTVASQGRLAALRRVLDDQNPASAIVFVREETSEREVSALLRSLGYSGPEASVRVGRAAAPEVGLVILFDLPATHAELREAVGASTAIALVQPRQVESLRVVAAGGALRPYALPDAGRRARAREAALRDELRQVISDQPVDREILALEPLLDDFDGVEIAAAALKLLERARESVRATPVPAPATDALPTSRESGPRDSGSRDSRSRDSGSRDSRSRDSAPRRRPDAASMTRLFVTVGERDHAGPADLLSAIANQPGMSSASVGKIEIRQSHSTVEVAADSVDSVIERLNGTTIRGRSVVARRDDEQRRSRTSDRASGGGGSGRPRRDSGSGRGNRR